MADFDSEDHFAVAERLRQQALDNALRVTAHAHQEMVAEAITLDEIREVLLGGAVIEDYSQHQRGACCLMCGETSIPQHIHVVCTTAREVAIIITAYEPKPPKWISPYTRGKAK